MTRGLIIAAPRSGSGKTTVTLALVAALRRRGVVVRCAKSGPDYIDPAFHEAASGFQSVNLDSWAMPPALLDALVGSQMRDADFLVIEASMGLFDGVGAAPRRGAAADLAARFGVPVLLVIDVSGQSQSAAAVACGFANFDPKVRVAGVLLNRIASARHRDGVVAAINGAGIKVFGAIARDAAIALPERHLGLVQASEHGGLAGYFDRLADLAERDFDMAGIIAAADAGLSPLSSAKSVCRRLAPPGQRIALAQDAAFSFIYPHILAGWRAAGAEIVAFSPLADAAPPEDCDACWLPGGYPELHAGRLAAALRFSSGIRAFARTRPVHGECGGFMVLGQGLVDPAGVAHTMTGLLDFDTSFAPRIMHLGYRVATLLDHGALGPAGSVLRGHEFHYARISRSGDDAKLALLQDAAGHDLGPAGAVRGRVSGSFFHVIAPQENEELPQ